MASIPRSTLVVGAVAVGLAGALAYTLTRPAPAPAPAANAPSEPYVPMPPARPGDTNPIAAKVLAEGGPRAPTGEASGSPSAGSARGVGRFAAAYDPAAPDGAWTCVEGAARHAATFATTDAPACPGAGAARLEGSVVLVRQPAPSGRGVDAAPALVCRATLTGTADGKPLRLALGPTPAVDGACDGMVAALREPFLAALAGPK